MAEPRGVAPDGQWRAIQVGQVRDSLGGHAERSFRDALEQVITEEVIPAFFGKDPPMHGAQGIGYVETMLIGNVVPFREQAERRGHEEGLKQGLEQGLERGVGEIRGVLARMARTRFGKDVSQRLDELLRPVMSVRLLGIVGDLLTAARTGEELLAKVAARLSAEPGNGRSPV